MEDDKIIALFLARNEQAIQETDAAYGGRLWSLSHRILNNREDAEESVSDTYMQAWESIPPQRPKFYFAYLAAICRHFSLNRVDWHLAAKRSAQVVTLTQEMELCIPDTMQEAQLESRELRRTLESFLEGLSRENRLIFLRRYLYADSIAEISQRYGITESKVKTQLHRTRTKLWDHLKQEGIYR